MRTLKKKVKIKKGLRRAENKRPCKSSSAERDEDIRYMRTKPQIMREGQRKVRAHRKDNKET